MAYSTYSGANSTTTQGREKKMQHKQSNKHPQVTGVLVDGRISGRTFRAIHRMLLFTNRVLARVNRLLVGVNRLMVGVMTIQPTKVGRDARKKMQHKQKAKHC
jgi:hypothetical protein